MSADLPLPLPDQVEDGRSPAIAGSGHQPSASALRASQSGVPNAGLTPQAKRFVALNRLHSVVMSEWLDKDRKSPSGPPETWVKMRLRFDNMQQITLHENDLTSMRALGIKPVWYHDRHPPAKATGAA